MDRFTYNLIVTDEFENVLMDISKPSLEMLLEVFGNYERKLENDKIKVEQIIVE